MQEISLRSLISGLLYTTEIADPTLPFILIGCVIVAFIAFPILRARKKERRLKKNILPDTTLDFESEVSHCKRELAKHFEKERYNYATGYIPGAEPELSFIDPARRGEPIEVITTKETYKPTAEPLVERPITVSDRSYPKGAVMSTPLRPIGKAAVPKPSLIPEIDVTGIKKPEITPVPTVTASVDVDTSKPAKTEKGGRDKRAEKLKNKNSLTKTRDKGPVIEDVKPQQTEAPAMAAVIANGATAPVNEESKSPEREEAKAPKIALASSVKKIEKSTDAPKDAHRIVITTVPVSYPKPPRKETKNEFKVTVEEPTDAIKEIVDEP